MRKILETFEMRKFQKGVIRFSTTSINDPFIQKAIDLICDTPLTEEFIKKLHQNMVLPAILAGKKIPVAAERLLNSLKPNEKMSKRSLLTLLSLNLKEADEFAKKAPMLSETIKLNNIEQEVFGLFSELNVKIEGASKFSKVTFYKLVRAIQVDHNEFWPLKGFIDRRPLHNPTFYFTDDEKLPKAYKKIPTACATPKGNFVFNDKFMQSLIDWAYLKHVKPKGRKYVSNGGDIPDDYCYLEFVIMHEFMHYTNDDFYYEKIIPRPEGISKGLHAKIINYVGDFRTNYLLVKSGYAQLPMGLFNDGINYDRQKTYRQMYDIVANELKKLSDEQQKALENLLDSLSDDHEPGNEEGEASDMLDDKEVTEGDIDENGRKVQGQMENAGDKDDEERKEAEAKARERQKQESKGPPGRGDAKPQDVDYSKIAPTFNWRTLVKRFIQSAATRTEETYAKPSRRGVSGLDIARQVGAAAIKPAEKPLEHADNKLCFVFDSSGSMTGIIGKIYANAVKLLKQPEFARTESIVFKYSGSYTIYRGNFATNKAGVITDIKKRPATYDMKMYDIFAKHIGGGTELTAALAADVNKTIDLNYNVIFFLDSDNTSGENLRNLVSVVKHSVRHVFIIFDCRETYIEFRKNAGISSPNITYFQD